MRAGGMRDPLHRAHSGAVGGSRSCGSCGSCGMEQVSDLCEHGDCRKRGFLTPSSGRLCGAHLREIADARKARLESVPEGPAPAIRKPKPVRGERVHLRGGAVVTFVPAKQGEPGGPGDLLRTIRLERGLTLRQLGERLGLMGFEVEQLELHTHDLAGVEEWQVLLRLARETLVAVIPR